MSTDLARDGTFVHGTDPDGTTWLRQTRAFALRNLRGMLRTKATVIWGFGFPAFWYLLTSVLFLPSAESIGGTAVLADVKGATAVSLGLFGVLTVTLVAFAGGLTRDLERKRYRKLRSLPIAPSADFAGRFLAGLVVAAGAYCLVLLVGVADGADYAVRSLASIPVVVLTFALFSLVGVSVAVLVTWLVEDSEIVVGITNAILLLTFFLTGYNGMSPGMLPERTRVVVNLVPNSLAARLQTWHLTETPASAAAGTSGGVTPPALPITPEYVALLAFWAIALGAGASVVMDRAVYSGEGGE
ncbi:MAG: ABC-2 type transport system permease protein [Natronomonas sp.]|jgi:ABC-2 type transport system permease protein